MVDWIVGASGGGKPDGGSGTGLYTSRTEKWFLLGSGGEFLGFLEERALLLAVMKVWSSDSNGLVLRTA